MPNKHQKGRDKTREERLKERVETILSVAILIQVSLDILSSSLALTNDLFVFWTTLEKTGVTASFI